MLSYLSYLCQETYRAFDQHRQAAKNLFERTEKINNSQSHANFETATNVEAVMYNDVNLSVMGSKNLPPSMFGERIARELFSDEELTQKMLFPVRDTGRKPLSPMRSKIFEKAVNARFSDEEALKVAVSAVKKLGIDLKRGRRKRRFDP